MKLSKKKNLGMITHTLIFSLIFTLLKQYASNEHASPSTNTRYVTNESNNFSRA